MSVNRYNSTTGELEKIAGGTLYADAPVGAIQAYGGSTAPSGWLLCQGQAVSRTEYADLFKAIGTAFGEGDTSTTFNIPDLREATTKGAGLSVKSPYHYDNAGLKVGQYVIDQLMRHDHKVYVRDTGHSHTMNYDDNAQYAPGAYGFLSPMKPTTSPRNAVTESGNANIQVNSNSSFDGTANTTSTAGTGVTNEVKAVGVNYIIKAKQIAVPTDIQSAIEEQNSYSTEETYTGKRWIDGKPIYRKVVEKIVSLPGNTWTSTGINVSEIDILCNCAMLNSNKYAFGGFYTSIVSNQLDVYCVSDANWNASTFILEYTKITD